MVNVARDPNSFAVNDPWGRSTQLTETLGSIENCDDRFSRERLKVTVVRSPL